MQKNTFDMFSSFVFLLITPALIKLMKIAVVMTIIIIIIITMVYRQLIARI